MFLFSFALEIIVHTFTFRWMHVRLTWNATEIIVVILTIGFVIWGIIQSVVGVKYLAGLIRVLDVLLMVCKLKQL